MYGISFSFSLLWEILLYQYHVSFKNFFLKGNNSVIAMFNEFINSFHLSVVTMTSK